MERLMESNMEVQQKKVRKQWEYMMTQYEYGIDKSPDMFEDMQRLGKLGWELCSVVHLDAVFKLIYYFKREKL